MKTLVRRFIFFTILLFAFLYITLPKPINIKFLIKIAQRQWEILLKREKIEKLLINPSINKKFKRKLEIVIKARDFASNKLEISTKNYQDYVKIDDEVIGIMVTSAPLFSDKVDQICFWQLFCFNYLGFFDSSAAKQWIKFLHNQGKDVSKSIIAGYSTLGFFSDPIFSTQLKYSEEDLESLIYHELAHEAIYYPNDTFSSEAVASFLEKHLLVIADKRKKVSALKTASVNKYQIWKKAALKLRDELKYCYQTSYSNFLKTTRCKINRQWRTTFKIAKLTPYWSKQTYNNAQLANISRYQNNHLGLERIQDECKKSTSCILKRLKKLKKLTPKERYRIIINP